MGLTSTNSLMWMPVATLLTTMTFGCDASDGTADPRQSEFARRAAAGDAGVPDSGDDEGKADGSVANSDDEYPSSADGGATSVTDDDAAVELTDNQIFGILAANNDAELSAAAAAEGQLQDPATVALATSVTRSASSAQTRHTLLARLADLTPEESEQSALRKRVEIDINTMLADEEPSESLDLRYAFGVAMTNEQLILLIDETLSIQADSELLKNELRTTKVAARRRATDASERISALAPSVYPEAAEPDSDVTDEETVEQDAGAPDSDQGDTEQPDAGAPDGDDTEPPDAGTL